MKRTRIIANDFFKKCGIISLPISKNKINEIVKTNGWELRYYSTSKIIISSLGLLEYSNTHNGFTYTIDDKIIIFIRDELDYLEKINIICHEIGHIVLGHTSYNGILGKDKNKYYENILEKEADIFSLEFQAPLAMLSAQNYDTAEKIFNAGILNKELSEIQYRELLEYKDRLKKENSIFKYRLALTGISMILVICIFLIYKQEYTELSKETVIKSTTQNYIKETLIETITESVTEIPATEPEAAKADEPAISQKKNKVKITKSGKKYHLPDCHYVVSKTNTIELEIEEALKKGYEPCSVCCPQ